MPAGDTGYMVLSNLPVNEYYQTIFLAIVVLIVVFIVGVVLVIIGMRVTAEKITTPIKELNETAQKLAEGNLDVELNIRSEDEIGELGHSISQTVDRLKEYIVYIDEITYVLDNYADGKLKIDFVANGGSAVDSITDISKNQTISLSSITPTREGYQFGGWYLDSTLQTKCPTKFTITQSITLYAKWEKTGVSALKVTYKGKPLNVDTVYEVDANGDTIIADNGKPSILRWEAALNRADLEVMAYNTDGTEGLISDYNIRLKEGKNNFDCAYEEPLLLFNKNGTTFPAYGQSIVMEVEKDGKTDTFEVYLAEYWGEDENVTSGTVKIEVYEDMNLLIADNDVVDIRRCIWSIIRHSPNNVIPYFRACTATMV